MTETVIFVDDDERCIDSIRRNLEKLQECAEWKMIFCTTPSAAIDEASRGHVSVLVTDEHMPDMSGHELISAIKKLHPNAVTILLSGDPERCSSPETVVIEKPFDAHLLAESIKRTMLLNSAGGLRD